MSQPSRFRNTVFGVLVAAAAATHVTQAAPEPSKPIGEESIAEPTTRRELVTALFQWIAATNERDFPTQSAFYPERMDAFYLWRNPSRSEVMAEKRKVFHAATTISIKADAPQIVMGTGGKSARTYFRKTYVIQGAHRDRRGEVLQELRWEMQPEGWKIVSERDLRVLRPALTRMRRADRR